MKTPQRTAIAAHCFLGLASILTLLLCGRELLALYHASAKGGDRLAGLERASELSPLNWRYSFERAGLEKAMGRNRAALEHFEQATRLFPACGRCWVGVAEAQAALGEDPLGALETAINTGRSTTEVRTRAAVVYARLDMDEEAVREFSAALGGQRRDRQGFYALLHRLYDDDFVLDRVVRDVDLRSYFSFALRNLGPGATARVWARFAPYDESERHRYWYVGYLLNHGYVHEAWRVGGNEPLVPGRVVNGDFEDLGDHGRFGWQITDGDGVNAGVTLCRECPSGSYGLRLRFDGEHNPHFFGVGQYLPVTPGQTYRLRARVRHKDITSVRGPSLAVSGLKGKAGDPTENCKLWVEGEQYRLTEGWHDSELEFTVPLSCEGIRIRLIRPQTKMLNRFIGGELWIDDVELNPVELDALPETGEQPVDQSAVAGYDASRA